MSTILVRAVLFTAAAAAALPAAAVELVTNGGFETGTFSGWTQFGGVNQTNVNGNDAVTGAWGARFSPNSPGGIKQDIATTSGTSYLVTFSLRKYINPNPNSQAALAPNNEFSVAFDNVVLTSLSNSGGFGLTNYSFSPVATGPLSSLVLTFRDNWNGPLNRWSIDNVSVTELGRNLGVPEPASWMMLLAGFGLVGFAARRNRSALPAVTA